MIPAGAAAGRAGARHSLVLCGLAATLAVPPASAGEPPLYVIEQLVVAVSSAPDGTGSRVGTLKSGDQVELLERQGDEAQIQLPNGTSGWVKASYLSSELPLQRRLQDRTAEVEKLQQDVSRLESQLAARAVSARGSTGAASTPTAASTVAAPSGAAGTPPAPPSGSTAMPAEGPPQTPSAGKAPLGGDPPPYMGPADPTAEPPWVWILTCSAGALAIGFVAGWRMLDRRIRRKYGGLRIY
jgi:hypothetical protein